ncbi:MAG: type III secretion HpaP family protein [Candidatus Methylacidiphilales bacterium]
MPDFIPLSSQAQDYAARQNDARRADESDIRRRAMDLRKRQADNQSKASTQLQQEVEQDADTFASFLTGESEGTDPSEKPAGSPFDVRGNQEDAEAAGDIFAQLLRQSGQESAEGNQGLQSSEQKTFGEEVSVRQSTGEGEADAAKLAGDDTAQPDESTEASPFSNPFMSWGNTGRQELEPARYAQSNHGAHFAESAGTDRETDGTEGASSSEGTGTGSDDEISGKGGDRDSPGASGSASLFGMDGSQQLGGAQGRGGSGDSSGGGGQSGGGGGDGLDRAAQEAAALNVASLQSSLLNAMQRPGTAGLDGINETAGAGSAQAAELIEKLGSEVVERLLVTDPAHQSRQEVRLKIRDSVLKDTEVRVYRDGDEVHVEFVTPSEESAQTLSQNASDLETTLRERLGASGVVIKIDKTDGDAEA